MIDLGILFRPLTAIINKRISEQTPARELAASLDGTVMAVQVEHTALAVYLAVSDGRLTLHTQYTDEPDVILTGTPISLASLAGKDPQAVIRDGHVRMSGDAMLGQKYQRLLKLAHPDLEDELAGVVGDVAANQAGNIARTLTNTAGQLGERLTARFGSFLTRDRQALPSEEAFHAFRDDVERLRDDVARAEARLKRLQPPPTEDD